MSNNSNQQYSNRILEAASNAMGDLIEGVSEMYKASIILKKLHDDKGYPVDAQRMSEISQMTLSMRKMLYEQKADLELSLAAINDDREIEECLVELDKMGGLQDEGTN